jgi:PAS domain-containing protein
LTPIDPSIYKVLLDQVADGVYIVDADRRIVCWNEGAARQTGYPEEEVLTGAVPRMGCVTSKQGRRVPVTARIQPLRGPDGST